MNFVLILVFLGVMLCISTLFFKQSVTKKRTIDKRFIEISFLGVSSFALFFVEQNYASISVVVKSYLNPVQIDFVRSIADGLGANSVYALTQLAAYQFASVVCLATVLGITPLVCCAIRMLFRKTASFFKVYTFNNIYVFQKNSQKTYLKFSKFIQ